MGDALRTMADKVYGDLKEEARVRLALNLSLTHIKNCHIAFREWQKHFQAMEATIELARSNVQQVLASNRKVFFCF